jgi:hypothetical protein
MNSELSNLISELEAISGDARKTFGNLSSAQINWKPSADAWSIGQCFEHLIKTNALFFPELERVASGGRRNSFLENYSPLSNFFGNLMVNSLKKDERKFKTPTPKIVPRSDVDALIVGQFAAHQADLVERIRKTAAADWKKTKITSPFMQLMTYKLADGFRILVEHERRHIRQANRALETENFPK